MAAKTPARSLYEVFLELVINIEAVRREREAVTDQGAADFFDLGRIPGRADFLWPLDDPEPQGSIVLGVLDARGFTSSATKAMSAPMQRAWDAAVPAFREFIAALANGQQIANGVHPVSGERHDLDPVEWSRGGLILDVRNGDLLSKQHGGKPVERWASIILRAKQRRQSQPPKKRGHGYDWDGAWAYALTLRAEDQWDWTQDRRHEKQPLPKVRKVVEEKIQNWFAARGNIPDISDIRRNIVAPLYEGKRKWGRRKR